MYISATVWTFIGYCRAGGSVPCYCRYIAMLSLKATPHTHVCQSYLQKKSTISNYYSLAYTFTYKDGDFIDMYQKLSPYRGEAMVSPDGRSDITSFEKGLVHTDEMMLCSTGNFTENGYPLEGFVSWSRCLMANIEYIYLPFCSKYCD